MILMEAGFGLGNNHTIITSAPADVRDGSSSIGRGAVGGADKRRLVIIMVRTPLMAAILA